MAPSRDDFTRWLDDPVTKWVMQGCAAMAEQHKAMWIAQSWDNGAAAPNELIRLRSRYDAYADLVETSYDSWAFINGDETRDD